MTAITSLPKTSTSYAISLIVLVPLALLILIYFHPFSADNNCDQPTPQNQFHTVTAISNPTTTEHDPDPEYRLLIGVLTLAKKYTRRHMLRMAYSLQTTPETRRIAHVDVRFVFCKLTSEEERAFVALEIQYHGDIIILDCAENMNDGKTYTYLSSLPEMFKNSSTTTTSRPYDYVMKVDDDTYLRVDQLVESLRGLAKEDMYYGLGYPFEEKKSPHFMVGMGYILSWDLVEWVATSELVKSWANGIEDIATGNWLAMANKAKNKYNVHPRMYNFQGPEPEKFIPNTIGVHMLKNDLRFAQVLEHFNDTRVEPSKFYKI